ncbi:hypothetical protein DRQ25_14600 [Candidatus Fermentibacteria bacterium]|nr:MAG: hypothetical protein DRQ25_14600 [Candidatus Fermentibacteria bacterium]
MPSPSKYTVTNVNMVLETVDELTISDKELRIKISEITGLIHPLALKQFIKAMEELDYITKSPYSGEEYNHWLIRDRQEQDDES